MTISEDDARMGDDYLKMLPTTANLAKLRAQAQNTTYRKAYSGEQSKMVPFIPEKYQVDPPEWNQEIVARLRTEGDIIVKGLSRDQASMYRKDREPLTLEKFIALMDEGAKDGEIFRKENPGYKVPCSIFDSK